jgi:hypothetical protein
MKKNIGIETEKMLTEVHFEKAARLLTSGTWECRYDKANPTLQKEEDIKCVVDALRRYKVTFDDIWCAYDTEEFAQFIEESYSNWKGLGLSLEVLLAKYVTNEVGRLFVEYHFAFTEDYLALPSHLVDVESDLRKEYILRHVIFYNTLNYETI